MVFGKKTGLTWELAKRDIETRYRGSALGLLWSLVVPIGMLLVYSFVFGVVFKSRWGHDTSMAGFSLSLFAGLLVFNFFAECVQRSTTLIQGHQNLVKKAIFPLEVLPMMVVISALVQAFISLAVLACAILIVYGEFVWTIALAPLMLLPVVLLAGGLCYALSGIAVYVRDLGQAVPIAVSALMFLSPIFYPADAIPDEFRFIVAFNPIAGAIEGMRGAVLTGTLPGWRTIVESTLMGSVVFVLGYLLFLKVKKGFADVL